MFCSQFLCHCFCIIIVFLFDYCHCEKIPYYIGDAVVMVNPDNLVVNKPVLDLLKRNLSTRKQHSTQRYNTQTDIKKRNPDLKIDDKHVGELKDKVFSFDRQNEDALQHEIKTLTDKNLKIPENDVSELLKNPNFSSFLSKGQFDIYSYLKKNFKSNFADEYIKKKEHSFTDNTKTKNNKIEDFSKFKLENVERNNRSDLDKETLPKEIKTTNKNISDVIEVVVLSDKKSKIHKNKLSNKVSVSVVNKDVISKGKQEIFVSDEHSTKINDENSIDKIVKLDDQNKLNQQTKNDEGKTFFYDFISDLTAILKQKERADIKPSTYDENNKHRYSLSNHKKDTHAIKSIINELISPPLASEFTKSTTANPIKQIYIPDSSRDPTVKPIKQNYSHLSNSKGTIITAHQNNIPSVSQNYVPPTISKGFLDTSIQQNYIPPSTSIQQNYVPPVNQNYIPPNNSKGSSITNIQQNYIPPVEQTYIPPIAQNYIPPSNSNSKGTISRPIQQTYIPPVTQNYIPPSIAHGTVARPIQQTYIPPGISQGTSGRPIQQNYIPPGISQGTPSRPIQQNYIPPLPQTYLPPHNEFSKPNKGNVHVSGFNNGNSRPIFVDIVNGLTDNFNGGIQNPSGFINNQNQGYNYIQPGNIACQSQFGFGNDNNINNNRRKNFSRIVDRLTNQLKNRNKNNRPINKPNKFPTNDQQSFQGYFGKSLSDIDLQEILEQKMGNLEDHQSLNKKYAVHENIKDLLINQLQSFSKEINKVEQKNNLSEIKNSDKIKNLGEIFYKIINNVTDIILLNKDNNKKSNNQENKIIVDSSQGVLHNEKNNDIANNPSEEHEDNDTPEAIDKIQEREENNFPYSIHKISDIANQLTEQLVKYIDFITSNRKSKEINNESSPHTINEDIDFLNTNETERLQKNSNKQVHHIVTRENNLTNNYNVNDENNSSDKNNSISSEQKPINHIIALVNGKFINVRVERDTQRVLKIKPNNNGLSSKSFKAFSQRHLEIKEDIPKPGNKDIPKPNKNKPNTLNQIPITVLRPEDSFPIKTTKDIIKPSRITNILHEENSSNLQLIKNKQFDVHLHNSYEEINEFSDEEYIDSSEEEDLNSSEELYYSSVTTTDDYNDFSNYDLDDAYTDGNSTERRVGYVDYNSEFVEELSCRCGVPQSNRIIGGTPTTILKYPWMAQQVLRDGDIVYCGASIINNLYTLTAAHCVIDTLPEEIYIRIGHTSQEMPGTNVDAELFITHRRYRDADITKYDIALIKLKAPLVFSEKVLPICLTTRSIFENEKGFITGWGTLTEVDQATVDVLHAAEVTVMEYGSCRTKSSYDDIDINKLIICAREKMIDSCQGDSGGPLVHFDGESFSQIGITSWGIGCGREKYPGIYTKVSLYYKWIRQRTRDALYCKTQPIKAPSTMSTLHPSVVTTATDQSGLSGTNLTKTEGNNID